MADFQPGTTVETAEPFVTVDASPQKPLPPGKMTFQLVVIDDAGNESQPVTADVFVLDTQAPTAILDAPSKTPAGQPFRLNGNRSSDIGGQIVRYRWTRVS